MLINILWNELRKEFFTTWSYRWQWLGEFVSLFTFFLFLSLLTHLMNSGVSYCIWFYSILIIGDISGKISQEMRTGTFEQLYLSPISLPMIFAIKVIASVLRSSIIMLCLLLLLFVFGYVDLSLLNYELLFVLFIISPGLFGISFLIGGITLIIKDTGWMINILNNSFLFLSGIFMPLDLLPQVIQNLSLVVPTTQAILYITENSGDALLIFQTNILLLGIGVICFILCERKAKVKGVLGHY